MINLSCFIFHHICKPGAAFQSENAIISKFHTRTGYSILIQKFNLECAFIILAGFQIKWYLQFFRSRNFTFHFGIIKRIFILQLQPLILQRNRSPNRRINIPVSQFRNWFIFWEIIIRMCWSIYFHRDRNTGNPHIFLVHTVRNPQITISRHSIAFLNTTRILRTVWFIISSITHGSDFAMYQIQCRIFQSIFTQRYSQRPTKFRRIIYSSVCTIT